MSSEIIKALNELCDDFKDDYGLSLLLMANLSAINRMLIRRGRGQELLNTLQEVIVTFREKNENLSDNTDR